MRDGKFLLCFVKPKYIHHVIFLQSCFRFKLVSNGRTPSYFNWAGPAPGQPNWPATEPNNANGNEDCVAMGQHVTECWNDDECTKRFAFACEMEL